MAISLHRISSEEKNDNIQDTFTVHRTLCTKVCHKVQTGLKADPIPTGLEILCIASLIHLIYM